MTRRRTPKKQQSQLILPGMETQVDQRDMEAESYVLQQSLRKWNALGFHIWRQNVGAASFGDGEDKRFVRFGFAGLSDTIGFAPGGLFIAAECKSEKGAYRPGQVEFLGSVEHMGGIALTLRPSNFEQQIDETLETLIERMERNLERLKRYRSRWGRVGW